MTDKGHSLESACQAFGVDQGKLKVEEHGRITPTYIDYNRRDVEATAELYEKLVQAFECHPIELPLAKAYSPASIGKAYLRGMGVRPILERQPDFPRDVLGFGMTAYYGGRAECRIRNVVVPVAYVDFLSMYPTVNALMGLWQFLTAERIEVIDATDETRAFLDSLTLDDCFAPETWRRFPTLVQLEPANDVLPVRADYEERGSWQIGVNPLTSRHALWYALPDVVAAKLLGGKAPKILRALTLSARGVADGLCPTVLGSEVRVDPRAQDFFVTVIEERKRRQSQFLKVLANSTSYGILAEMIRHELAPGQREEVDVFGLNAESFRVPVGAPEEAGAYAFPPLAACISASARLMLAMLERAVTDKGGSYAMCDTDAMAIVTTDAGGLVECPGGLCRLQDGQEAVRALSAIEVEQIHARFVALNPYDQTVCPGSILEFEKENVDPKTGEARQLHCLAISSKRYALFNLDEQGRPILRKASEHGLGHLLNPTDAESSDRKWMRQLWEVVVCEALGLSTADLPWLDRPAVSRITASSPAMLSPLSSNKKNGDSQTE